MSAIGEPIPHLRDTAQLLTPADFVPQVRGWWREKLAISGEWPAEDICYGLAERFVDIVIDDRTAFEAARGRSCIYLANHQVGVESYLFSILVSGLSGIVTPVVAKAEHRQSWIGRIVAHSVAYPGIVDPKLMVLVEREHPQSVAQAFHQLEERLKAGQNSVIVHVEGTRSLSCRQSVTRLSPALLDMALAANVPVVPVRFAGGLPVEPAGQRLEFPVGYGRQQYRIGRPIQPDELADMRYGDRTIAALSALNTLGPGLALEMPATPDLRFAHRVTEWMDASGASHEDAVIFATLAGLAEPGPSIRRLLDGAQNGHLTVGKDAAAQWLGTLARMLYGPRGPQVIGLKEGQEP